MTELSTYVKTVNQLKNVLEMDFSNCKKIFVTCPFLCYI